jgi:hypothetical protein
MRATIPNAERDTYFGWPSFRQDIMEGTTMGYASTTVASGHCPSVRRHLNAGVTVASAGILALGLVAAPPGVRGLGTEVRQVQLAALALPPPALLGALEKFISHQAQTVLPGTKVVAVGAADIPAAVVKTPTAGESTPSIFDPAIDPAPNPQRVDAAALAPTTTALAISAPLLAAIPEPILAVVGIILLFGPIILLVILACPPCALFNFLTFTIPSLFIPFAPLSAVSAASIEIAPTDPTLANDPLLSDVSPAATAAEGSADPSPSANTRKVVVSPDTPTRTEQVASPEPATGNELTSTDAATSAKDVKESVKAGEVSAGRTEASAPKPAKLVGRPESPRPVVRDSLGAGKQMLDQSQRGNGGRPTTQGPANDGAATTGTSSAASSSDASSSAGSSSPGGGSSDGDAGDSE